MKHTWMAVRAAGVVLVFSGGCAIIAGLNHDYEQESGGGGGGGEGGGGGGSGGGIPVGPGGGLRERQAMQRELLPELHR